MDITSDSYAPYCKVFLFMITNFQRVGLALVRLCYVYSRNGIGASDTILPANGLSQCEQAYRRVPDPKLGKS